MTRPVSLAVLALLLLAGCGGGDPVSEADAPITIGAIFDLTGATSDVGTMYSEAIRDYYARLNDLGGIAGRPVELLWNDYGYDVAKAEQLYSEYVQAGSVMFMGWGTGDTEALRGRIAADRIPFVSASFSHVLGDPSEAPFNFLVGTTYSDQLFILLDYLIEEA
ncbi:MAG: ABC transporter substrate-binding protein, partial [Acidobacteriota bacterium]|nr:ABC transporter substrate-binding protein [Acidobacteriota bacterium]